MISQIQVRTTRSSGVVTSVVYTPRTIMRARPAAMARPGRSPSPASSNAMTGTLLVTRLMARTVP